MKRKGSPIKSTRVLRNKNMGDQPKKLGLEDIWAKLDKLDKLDTIEENIKSLNSTCNDLKEKHVVLEKTVEQNTENIDELQAVMNNMQFELNNLQQEKLDNNIIINGIPTTEENNLNITIEICSMVVNAEVKQDHIKYIRRMKINSANQPIVVTFHDRSLKIDVLRCWQKLIKTKKIDELQNQLKSKLNITNEASRINISEENTRFTQNIFKEAKDHLSSSFKFIWKRRGIIFVRKTENSKIIKITSLEQIQQLKIE